MSRRRKRFKFTDTTAVVLFTTGVALLILVDAARSGNLAAMAGTAVLAVVGLVALVALLRAAWRMVANSMVVYHLRRFLSWGVDRWTHASLRDPEWFGTVGKGEVVYALAYRDPRNRYVHAIKLGWSENFEGRLKNYRTLACFEVVVLAVGPGTYAFEQHILRLTKGDWTRGSGTEWRWPTTDVWELVTQLPGANHDVIEQLRDEQPVGVG